MLCLGRSAEIRPAGSRTLQFACLSAVVMWWHSPGCQVAAVEAFAGRVVLVLVCMGTTSWHGQLFFFLQSCSVAHGCGFYWGPQAATSD